MLNSSTHSILCLWCHEVFGTWWVFHTFFVGEPEIHWFWQWLLLFSCQVTSNSLWPLDCSRSGFSVPHHLPEFAQVHVHWISDATQPSHLPLLSSPSAFSLSQHQGLFQWVGCLHQAAKVLELQLLTVHRFVILRAHVALCFLSSLCSLITLIMHKSAWFSC